MGFFDFLKGKSKDELEADALRAKIMSAVFPGGHAEVTKHAQKIKMIFNNKLSITECEAFVRGSKTVIHVAEDKTAERIVPSLMNRAHGKVTQEEAYKAYLYLSGGGVSYSGGDGSSIDKPVLIHAQSSVMGVPAEYAFVTNKYGTQNEAWKLKTQYLLKSDSGRDIDLLLIELQNGNEVKMYFDITEFFGKF